MSISSNRWTEWGRRKMTLPGFPQFSFLALSLPKPGCIAVFTPQDLPFQSLYNKLFWGGSTTCNEEYQPMWEGKKDLKLRECRQGPLVDGWQLKTWELTGLTRGRRRTGAWMLRRVLLRTPEFKNLWRGSKTERNMSRQPGEGDQARFVHCANPCREASKEEGC